MEKIKVGQIGVCHEHAIGKINTLKLLDDVYEIVGVVDDRDTTAAKHAGENMEPYKDLKFITEEELFNTPGLQAVSVEVPNTDLVPVAMRCMERGLAMHMDKPAGEDLGLYKQLLDGCAKGKVPLQMGYMFRGNPAFQFCIKAIRENWLGEIFEIQASMSHNYGGETYQPYIGSFKGGIMFNLGCHLIDFVVAAMGRPINVTPFMKSTGVATDSIKNNCMTVLEYPHGTATLRSCSMEVGGFNRRLLKICGTKGTVELCPLERFDGQALEMRVFFSEEVANYPAGDHTIRFPAQRDRYEVQLNELAKIIRGEIENPYTYEHDYLVHEVTLAASDYIEWKK